MVQVLDAEIGGLDRTIDSLEHRMNELLAKEKESMDRYARSVVALQRRKRQTDRLLFILSAKDFAQGVRRMRFVTQYAQAHKRVAQELRATREEINRTRLKVQAGKEEKSKLLALREREARELRSKQGAKEKQVGTLTAEQKKLEQQVAEQKKRAAQLEAQIQKQIAYEIAEAERKAAEERRRAEEAAKAAKKKGKKAPKAKVPERKAETKGGYAMNDRERALAGTFAANKGKLPPPVDGSYVVSRKFGIQQHDTYNRVQTDNSGIDLTVQPGTHAVAVFDGVVTKIFVVPGYNSSVIIRHGNYLTVYTNLTNLTVRSGQEVKRGQKLGTIAQDATSGKHVLQFQVWHERQKTNPLLWIR